MRIQRFDLKAFGPFTDRVLAFDSEAPGLHIIFGPNESGKSSSLRALKALLYGFDERTPDNFIHSNDKLLVGGLLETSDGRSIHFQRRKKRKADIIDMDGNPLASKDLYPFLRSVAPEIFESLYGIDHKTLVQGGEDILAQKGEVGQALFAAGAGISSLRHVIENFENEAKDLFKSAGKLPEINKAIKRYKELQKEAKRLTLSIKEWKDKQKELKNAQVSLDQLEAERLEKNKELKRLERLGRAIPELASLKNYQAQLQELGDVILLPPDFSDRHQQVSQEIREAKLQLEKDAARLKKIAEKKKAISINKALLNRAEQVDDFHQRLGEYRKGMKDKPRLDGMRIGLVREAAESLKQVRPDLPLKKVEELRPVLAKKRTVQALSSKHEGINQQLNQAQKQIKSAEQELQEIEKSISEVPEIKAAEGLSQALKLAQKAGNLDVQVQSSMGEVEEGKKTCLAELKRIGLWSGDLPALMELSLPLSETVQQFEKRYSDIAEERRDQEKERKTAKKKLNDATAEFKKMEYAGEVPSEEELANIREKREQGWQFIRRQWLDGEKECEESQAYGAEKSLPEAYEGYVVRADHIADRLRREAERVANSAALRAQVETLENFLAENDKITADLDSSAQQLNDAWSLVWKPLGITPLSPKEMSGWLAEIDKLRYKAGEIFKKEKEIARDRKRRQELKDGLLQELQSMGEEDIPAEETLNPVVIFAETVLDRISSNKENLKLLNEKKKKAQKTLKQARDDHKVAQEDLNQWQGQWEKALSGLGLADEISPTEAPGMIDTLQDCFNKLKDADDLKKRIDGIDRDAAELEKAVKTLIEEADPDMGEINLEQAVLQLRTRLSQAQKDKTLYEQYAEEVDALEKEISKVEKTLKSAEEQMDELVRIAKSEKPEALAEIIIKFNEYKQLKKKISDTEETLTKIGAGTTIEALDRQAAAVSADELPGQIDALQQDINDRINPEIINVSQTIGEIQSKIKAMDGSAEAAEAAEKMEQELARIRRLAERYLRVKLASRILQQEIERYRDEHQDPVLKIASKYFSELTLGAFEGLRTDIDDKGDPILVGIRPDGAWVKIEGMSDGTRDQLYLALRLGTLEWRLESNEPMPFIVDDILINFDDDRSRATLKALAELSKKNQVILFTHHGQIVSEVKKLKKPDIQIHEL
ncbi:MAG: AAA family ATPase [Thermodesulfobacteriota bacterium]|nr:AAA family ATPase [Thermodesulfobacteriota bacterium]